MKIAFRLPIEPQSLQTSGKRIRIVPNKRRPGKFLPMHFADPKADAFRKNVAWLCAQHRPKEPLQGPLRLKVYFVLPRPGSLNRWKDPVGRLWSARRPDISNLLKGFEDILTRARFWQDDGQIARSELAKLHAARGEETCIEVEIESLEPAGSEQPRLALT